MNAKHRSKSKYTPHQGGGKYRRVLTSRGLLDRLVMTHRASKRDNDSLQKKFGLQRSYTSDND